MESMVIVNAILVNASIIFFIVFTS
jgi:hypothetical protein